VPIVTADGKNISGEDWNSNKITIPDKLACFQGSLYLGTINETGAGIVKKVFVETFIKVLGEGTAQDYIMNSITCDDCFQNMQTILSTYGFQDANGVAMLLNITDISI
ncbi:MAG: hypothetical protein ACK56I_35695, partial [bacterium]